MVKDFGSYLKHERKSKGVSLEEISESTKIHIRFLKALENNSFDELPEEVFIKGYIRSYANIIGFDVEEMLDFYKESVESKNQENIPIKISSVKTQSKTLLTFGLLILVVVGLLFWVGSLMKKGGDPEQVKVPSMQEKITISEPPVSSHISENRIVEENIDVQEADSAEPETPELSVNLSDQLAQGLNEEKVLSPEEPVELNAQNSSTSRVEENIDAQEADSAEPETPELSVNLSDQLAQDLNEEKVLSPEEPVELNAQNSSTSRADPSPQNPEDVEKPLKLTIKAKENSWFNMTIDDLRNEDFILPAGTVKTFWGNEAFRLTVGNKTGVELLLNGKVLTLPEGKNKVVKDFIINSKLVETGQEH